jgi:hypothetical protein
MPENGDIKKAPGQPWPEDYPSWLIEILEFSMEETGMSREEAENSLNFEMQYGGMLVQAYVAKLKAYEKEKKGTDGVR